MKIRTAHLKDVATLAEIHTEAFRDFFLTSLGTGFLKTYYKASLKSSESIAFVALDAEDNIIGFSSGCAKAAGFHKRLILSNMLSFILQGLLIFFGRPKAILRLLLNLDKNENTADDGNYTELLSIAVLPSHKGEGIGRALIQAFEQEAIKRGCKRIALTTDFTNNQDVILFYKNSGYEVFYDFTTYPDRKMYKFIKYLSK